MTSMLEFMNTVQNNKVETYSPVNTCNTSVNKPIAKEQSAQISTPTQDTFEKKDKKKTIKNIAIGTSIALLAYSTFALVKYRKNYGGLFNKLAEPIKVLKARVNPNGFKPSVSIEENEIKYLSELFEHICRLSKKQQDKFVNNLYSRTTQEVKNALSRHFNNVINR